MKYMEVLFVRGEAENVVDVFLHKKGENTILRETSAQFNCRMTRPHQYLYEIRTVDEMDSRLEESLWYLRMLAIGKVRELPESVATFTEVFLVGTGFYMPDTLPDYD